MTPLGKRGEGKEAGDPHIVEYLVMYPINNYHCAPEMRKSAHGGDFEGKT